MNNLKFFGGGFPLVQAPFGSVMFTPEQSEGIYSYAVASVPLGCYAPSSHSASHRGAICAHSLDYHKGSKRPVCSLYITPRDRAVYHARLGEHITQESTLSGCFLAYYSASGSSISAVTTKFLTDSMELSHCLRVV